MGYYSKRKDDLEKRKSDVISRIYADKLSLKSINGEIMKCDEAIQKLGEPGKKEFTIMQKQINDLEISLSEKDKEVESLKKGNVEILKFFSLEISHRCDFLMKN